MSYVDAKHPLSFPFLGMPYTAFLRLQPPAYSDQVGLPRGGLTNSSLPSARAVSVVVHQAHEETNHKESISQMVMQFGQGGNLQYHKIFTVLTELFAFSLYVLTKN